MDTKPKIKISEEAYSEILKLFEVHKEYDCLRLELSKSCCSNKVQLLLDTAKDEDILDSVDGVKVIYDKGFFETLKEVTLIYEHNKFMIKSDVKNSSSSQCKNYNKDCNHNSCNKDCGNCH